MHCVSVSVRCVLAAVILALGSFVLPAKGQAASEDVLEQLGAFEEVYTGRYSDTFNILLALGKKEGVGFVALSRRGDGRVEYLFSGELLEQGDGYVIYDRSQDSLFPFTIVSRRSGGMKIKVEGGVLNLTGSTRDALRRFLNDMVSGEAG